jgi:hypothetical protein
MAQPRAGRDWLCHTDEVTDTRHWEPRRRGQFTLIDAEIAAAGERLVRPPRPIAGAAVVVLRRADGRGGGVPIRVSRVVAPDPMVRFVGASSGGWAVGADAQGGSRRAGEEVR